MITSSFWQGKNVLITGHTGFKGAWLALWLQSLNANVIGYALASHTAPDLFTLANVSSGMTSIIGDIGDFSSLHEVIKTYRPEIIIHLAAQSLVRYSYDQPVETYATNVMGTIHLLEAVRQTDSVKAVVNVTSDKCYENKGSEQAYHEHDTLGGYDPYSNSKACAELVTAAYRSSYFNASNVGIASVRAGNVVGGGDWAQDRLVPDLIRACINQSALDIRYPNAIRPWQYVLDPLCGYLMLAEKLYTQPADYAQAWNFGPEMQDAKTVQWITDYVSQLWGYSMPVRTVWSSPHETHHLTLDCSKAKTKLLWKPRCHVESALQETVKWYQAYHEQQVDMHDFSLMQIERYSYPSYLENNSDQ